MTHPWILPWILDHFRNKIIKAKFLIILGALSGLDSKSKIITFVV
jgi:hypothetical protein